MATTYALLIGIEDYSMLDRSAGNPQGTSDLRGARNDVHAMAMLVRTMDIPAENIRVLSSPLMGPNDFDAVAMALNPAQNMNMVDATFGYASRQEILSGISWLAEKLAEDEHAQGVLYFSGHSILTQDGHPCLAPADTILDAPRIGPIDPAAPDAIDRYVMLTAGLVPMAKMLKSRNVSDIMGFLGQLYSGEDLGDPGWLHHCAAQVCPEITEEDVITFMQTLSNLNPTEDIEINMEIVAGWLGHLRESIHSIEQLESLVSGDPLAEASKFGSLISFNKAFYAALREVPEDRNVHVLLETCMEGRPNDYYSHRGLPLAHGNIVMLSSCHIGQFSERAVFNNRWHGAFTWAVSTLLSQTPVFVAREGRSFTTVYDGFEDKLRRLLRLMGFAQEPGIWAQPAQRNWRVFGAMAGEWRKRDILQPRRVREEVDAGTTGQIYKIVDEGGSSSSTAAGWLVVTASSGVPTGWAGGREYWFWAGADYLADGTSFKLVCPDAGYTSTSLEDWINHVNQNQSANLSPSSADIQYGSQSFSTGNPAQPLSGYFKIRKNSNDVAAMKKVTGKLVWQQPSAGGARLAFAPANQIVLAASKEIAFDYTPGSVPAGLTGKKAEDII